MGLVKRKLANTTYPTVEFIKDQNDSLIFKSHTVIKTSETKFKLGEEFDEDRLDGKRVKVRFFYFFLFHIFHFMFDVIDLFELRNFIYTHTHTNTYKY